MKDWVTRPNATDWIAPGAAVRCLWGPGRKPGERVMGEGSPDTAWLCVGAAGKVVAVSAGYPRHRCPDHAGAPDCVCGDEGPDAGWVPAMESWATVEYETDKPGRAIRRAITRSSEGETWERAGA